MGTHKAGRNMIHLSKRKGQREEKKKRERGNWRFAYLLRVKKDHYKWVALFNKLRKRASEEK